MGSLAAAATGKTVSGLPAASAYLIRLSMAVGILALRDSAASCDTRSHLSHSHDTLRPRDRRRLHIPRRRPVPSPEHPPRRRERNGLPLRDVAGIPATSAFPACAHSSKHPELHRRYGCCIAGTASDRSVSILDNSRGNDGPSATPGRTRRLSASVFTPSADPEGAAVAVDETRTAALWVPRRQPRDVVRVGARRGVRTLSAAPHPAVSGLARPSRHDGLLPIRRGLRLVAHSPIAPYCFKYRVAQ